MRSDDSKEEKPTLAGVTSKTRKRNIVIPEDPGSFADAVIQIVQDASTGGSVESELEAAGKALDASELEWSRYSDTLFEVFFAGGRLATAGNLADDGKRLSFYILACPPDRESILPFIKVFQGLTRRRPFLIRGLENTLTKLLLSLEFFNEEGRRKLGIALALTFTLKVGVLPENIFQSMLNDRLVAKGTVLEVITVFFQEYLVKDSLDDLVSILTKGKVVNRLLELCPPNRRTTAEFTAHFKAAGLVNIAEWNTMREVEFKVAELQDSLMEMVTLDPPPPAAEVLAYVKAKRTEHELPDVDVLRVIWIVIISSVNMTGKNQQQITQAIMGKIKTYRKLMSTFATNAKNELALLNTIQVLCYEDNRLLKIFSDVVRMLYDAEIVGEDTIQHWYKKGSHQKGRNVFLKDIEPFMTWLEEAEEEEEGEEGTSKAPPAPVENSAAGVAAADAIAVEVAALVV
ncbi:MAG: hypothetical protein WDW36_003594 [Sanguina aurantia]